MEQAAIPGFDVINTNVAEVAIDHPSNEGDPKNPTGKRHTTSTTTGLR
jgi:hypothetical protein